MKPRYDFMRCDKEQKVYTERSGGGAVQRMDDAALTLIDVAALIAIRLPQGPTHFELYAFVSALRESVSKLDFLQGSGELFVERRIWQELAQRRLLIK
ncbi:hypothetical protein PISMIDRAFT_579296 [Pisolithus microcarpus 441]|uniref:Uncharacterized protein n=1 Tax=Pisolithus microcarpus 441 TaxID=765257 RepID=A0A0C9YJY9_9AGAM|nr:hypothetical protein PISMIDRAFT_579296 [Pisolithus microcarpus 441]